MDSGITAGGTTATSTLSATNVALTKVGGTTFAVSSGATNGIDLDVSGTLNHTTGVSDSGLIKSGNGVMRLSGVNTYTSATTINGGTVLLSGAGSINGSSGITVNGSGANSFKPARHPSPPR